MKSFEAVLRTDPHNAEARVGEVKSAIAAALEAKRAGDNDGAMVYLVRARKYVPDDPELLFDFGVQADGMHLYKDAEEALTRRWQLAREMQRPFMLWATSNWTNRRCRKPKRTCANTSS